MGREKRKMEETEASWDRKAQAESLRCNVCSQQIIYDERELYYEESMCSRCSHQASKDD
jgi:DNA-directed RNA polymerase subunit RPC12/RpoP